MNYLTTTFAYSYNAGSYGGSAYATGSNTSSAQNANQGATANGTLSNTGFDILAVVTIACVIIFAALLIRFWRRSSTVEKKT